MKLKDGLILREVAGQFVVVPTGKRVQEVTSIVYISSSGAYLWDYMKDHEFQKEDHLADFCASVTGDQETWPALMAVEGETLDTFYAGLSAIATQQCLVQMAMISASGDEIALVEVENSGDVQAVKDIFQARIDYQVGDGTSPGGAWYPAPTEMWRNESRIVSNGNFVMLVAHTGADAVVEQFNALFA